MKKSHEVVEREHRRDGGRWKRKVGAAVVEVRIRTDYEFQSHTCSGE